MSFKVVVTDQVFPDVEVETEHLTRIGARIEVADGTVDDVVRRAADADALLNTYLPIDKTTVAALPSCRVIARYGIGVDNVDLSAARAAGIVVTNVPDYCVEEVTAHTVALLLALLRRVPDADRAVRAGQWGLDGLRPIQRLSHVTVGLVGFGRIGRRVFDVLRALGCRTVVHDPHLKPDDAPAPLVGLEDLLRSSDAVSLHVPLTAETKGLVNAATLGLMRPHAVLVNTSRGGLVDVDDLVRALERGTIRAAALDVLPHEPADAARIAGPPNLLLTPHMAYYSEQAIRESQRKAAVQVVKVLTGAAPDYTVT